MSTRTKAVGGNDRETMTEHELFEIVIMILPETDAIKKAFLTWASLPKIVKIALEARLDNLATASATKAYTGKDIQLYRGYCMGRVLLRVFHEWSRIQDTLGAPGIQSGYCSLTKRLEMDIAFMMRCMQEQLELVMDRKPQARSSLLNRLKLKFGINATSASSAAIPIGSKRSKLVELSEKLTRTRLSVSETAMPDGDNFDFGDHSSPYELMNVPRKSLRIDDCHTVRHRTVECGVGTNSDSSDVSEDDEGVDEEDEEFENGEEDSDEGGEAEDEYDDEDEEGEENPKNPMLHHPQFR